jgi:hypothetical protein
VQTSRIAVPVLIAATILSFVSAARAQITGFGGAANTGWTPNDDAASSGAGVPNVVGTGTLADVLSLTTAANSEASTYWFNTPQSITNFSESFTYKDISTNGADGIAAVWQNVGTSALGVGGGNLGFANLAKSAGLAMNIFSGNSGSGSEYNDTVTTGSVALTPTPGGVNIASGDPINVFLSYKESDHALTETMTDTITNTTFTRVWRSISIQTQVGNTTATVGLTGATGGVNAAQSVTNFQYIPAGAINTPIAQITPVNATGYNQNMIISAANGSANTTATMDGGTGKGGDTFYERGVNGGASVIIGSANDANHTFILQPNGQGQNDAVMLDSANPTGALTLTSPKRYSVLSFLVSSGNGANNMNVTINYAGGGTQIASVAAPDWFNSGPIALAANGRVDTALDDFNATTNGQPRMFQEDLILTDTVDPVTSVGFTFGPTTQGNNRQVVFGISGQVVPEPASVALLIIGGIGLLLVRRRMR